MNDEDFDERDYLSRYPDVKEAVRSGTFVSGVEHFRKFGAIEGREAHSRSRRERIVFSLINENGLGLEIGPSHSPLAPKRKGYSVDILDHATASDLRRKYAGHGVDLDGIEEVDYVWGGESLLELIGKVAHYDWIIASHVIEHIPDPLAMLQQCESLLKPGGVISLVIPDKR